MTALEDSATQLATDLGLELASPLPARSNQAWRARSRGDELVLRCHHDLLEIGGTQLGRGLSWQAEVRELANAAGWPTPRPRRAPFRHAGRWWTLEEFLPGRSRRTSAAERARLLADWHATTFPRERLGPCPGAPDRLAILTAADAAEVLGRCADPEDRRWLLRRLEQAAARAEDIDWSASRTVVVHGDLTDWNLLWTGDRLTGLLDLELATVDRRVADLVLTWRCRHDDLLMALDRIDPLTADEWRMLLVDWWAQLLTLAAFHLRRGRQPDRWELDGLRRESPLSRLLVRGERPGHAG
ncbi:hypothetical protein BH708_07610 [Brachybacterium sp. P6-10-X1]|uniref:phosphotransferase enzyme family protein n=1 Tax=Brachybacterium sp. P6-10-X1 TaxID=1903186 RepID=UPI0009719192|nr:phosphotransferase [Brachybacterium sp. P6-10-X1]APX32606.1 hypothetical protein BH708_07610 [Brachybacterium sp. P6-10-X1]